MNELKSGDLVMDTNVGSAWYGRIGRLYLGKTELYSNQIVFDVSPSDNLHVGYLIVPYFSLEKVIKIDSKLYKLIT